MKETILITGANRGIGFEVSRLFAQYGWRVIACCRKPDEAMKLGVLQAASEGRLEIFKLDVRSDEQIEQLQEKLSAVSIDILLNNAGIFGPQEQEFGRLDESEWLETFQVNTIAPYKMTVAMLDNITRSSRRLIATIGSQMGSLAENNSGGYYAYRSAKAGVHMVMKSMSIDLASKGICAVTFHPGWVRTDLGGLNAPLSPTESAQGLFNTMLALEAADNGRFLDYQGNDMAW